MTETLGFALPIRGILRQGERIPLTRTAAILRAICRDEQYLLPKRIAQGLSHRLGAPALHYWGMSLTLQLACSARRHRYGVARKVHGSRNVEPCTDIYRR